DLVAAGAVLHDPERRAVGDDALGVDVRVAVGQPETAVGRLVRAEAQAGGAGELEDLVGIVVEYPEVGTVGGDALQLGGRAQAAGRLHQQPVTHQSAAGVVDVDVFVRVHDPDRRAGRGAGGAARRRVAAVERIVLTGGAVRPVLIGPVRAAVVDDVKLGVVV